MHFQNPPTKQFEWLVTRTRAHVRYAALVAMAGALVTALFVCASLFGDVTADGTIAGHGTALFSGSSMGPPLSLFYGEVMPDGAQTLKLRRRPNPQTQGRNPRR